MSERERERQRGRKFSACEDLNEKAVEDEISQSHDDNTQSFLPIKRGFSCPGVAAACLPAGTR
jgi:hypothetical protein